MSLIKIIGVQSLSAPTKAQKDAAIYMFGKKGHEIVAVLEKLSKAKELRAPHLVGLLALMKDGEDEEIIKFVGTAAGKKTLVNAKTFATAKTLTTAISALKLIRVPMKWVPAHSDVAAAAAQETREVRARRTAGNKPEKPIKMDNPGAPEATIGGEALNPKRGSATPKTFKPHFLKVRKNAKGEYETTVQATAEQSYRVALKRTDNTFTNDVPMISDIQRFITQGMEATGAQLLHVSGKSIEFDTKGADAFEKWLKSIRGAKALTSTKLFPLISPNRPSDTKKPTPKPARVPKPKPTPAPAESKPARTPYQPSGRSATSLVDDLAEIPAKKIAAKGMHEREEYFNALATVLQQNLQNKHVSVTSDGVVVNSGSRYHTISLGDKGWMLQLGATGKQKRIGNTFDIVDLMGMLDKNILRPKPDAAKPVAAAEPKVSAPKAPTPKADAAPKPLSRGDEYAQRGLKPEFVRIINNEQRRNTTLFLALGDIARDPNFDLARVDKYVPRDMLSIETPICNFRLGMGERGWPEIFTYNKTKSGHHSVEFTSWDMARTAYVSLFRGIEDGTFTSEEALGRAMNRYKSVKTLYGNERKPYRMSIDSKWQSPYDLDLQNMTPANYKKADRKTRFDFGENYIAFDLQHILGHDNWVNYEDTGTPMWEIEYNDTKMRIEPKGSSWELTVVDGSKLPMDLGAILKPHDVAKKIKALS